MNCERYDEWLHLHRPGELNRKDREALESHLGACPRCSALSERIAASEGKLARLRGPLPEAPDAAAAAGEVLRRIGAAHSRPRRSIAAEALDILLTLFDRPRIRYAAAVLLGLLGGTLVVQQLSVMRDVASLEDRMARPQEEGGMIQTAFVVNGETISRLPDSRELLETLGDRVRLDRNASILITREEAAALRDAVTRALAHDRRIRGILGRNRTAIDEAIRDLQSKPNTVFRVLRKGGA
jgi:hypothetical protein